MRRESGQQPRLRFGCSPKSRKSQPPRRRMSWKRSRTSNSPPNDSPPSDFGSSRNPDKTPRLRRPDTGALRTRTPPSRTAAHRGDVRARSGRMPTSVRRRNQSPERPTFCAITTYFDLQGGLRSDIDSRPTRNWAAFGIQGLAPYFFDLEITGFVSGEGHLAAKLEASYDLLLTQRLILQPQIELNVYSKGDPARLLGAGFSEIDTVLRLPDECTRNFAP